MPFGLKNAGATFMRMIQKCLLTQISRNVEAYMDDIVVKSRKGSNLLTDLTESFANLRRHDIKLNPSKCTFRVLGRNYPVFSFPNEGSTRTRKRMEQFSERNALCVCMMFRSLLVVWLHWVDSFLNSVKRRCHFTYWWRSLTSSSGMMKLKQGLKSSKPCFPPSRCLLLQSAKSLYCFTLQPLDKSSV